MSNAYPSHDSLRDQKGQYAGSPHLAPLRVKRLADLVSRIPEHAFETSRTFKHTKKNALEGLAAEYNQPESLDELVWRDISYRGEYTFGRRLHTEDLLVDHAQQKMLDEIELKEFVFQLLKELAERRYQWFEVIMFRYGFWDGTVWSLQAIGEQFTPPVTREYVRQLEVRALDELRNILYAWALEYEIQSVGIKRPFRSYARPHRVEKPRHVLVPQDVEPTRRGRPPKVYRVDRPSELDKRSYMPVGLLAEYIGASYPTVRQWTQHPDFPEPKMTGKRKTWLLSQVLMWAFEHDHLTFE